MDYGLNRSGELVEAGSADAVYLLEVREDRSMIHRLQRDEGPCSMYHFGRIACWAITVDFDWKPMLSVLPDPGTPEKIQLREKLSEEWEFIRSFIDDEIGRELTRETFDDILEAFCRLFPAYGHFSDMVNFLSDNYYSFDPSWSFKEYQSAPTFQKLIEEAFGGYRKDLARAVSQSSGSAISLLAHFSGSITAEQMVKVLMAGLPDQCAGWGFLGSRFDEVLADLSSLDLLTPSLRFHLVEDLVQRLKRSAEEDGGYDGFETVAIIEDTLTMLRSVPKAELKRFRSDRSWNQVHSRAVALASEDDVEGLDSLSLPQALEALDGEVLGNDLRLALLRRPVDFLRAGSQSGLDNCMGKAGYYTKAKNGESYCLVGYAEGSLRAGIELTKTREGWKVLQLNGPHNDALEEAGELERELLNRLNGDTKLARKGDLSPRVPRADGILEIREEVAPGGQEGPLLVVQDLPPLEAAQLGIVGDMVRVQELLFGDEIVGEPERLQDLELFDDRQVADDLEAVLPVD